MRIHEQDVADMLATVLNLFELTGNELEVFAEEDGVVIRINSARGYKPVDVSHNGYRWVAE